MWRIAGLVCLLPLGAVLPALAQEFEKGSVPDWVEVLAIPASPPDLLALSAEGVFFPLSDVQIRWDGEDQITYYRHVTQITERAGLEEAAPVEIILDPGFEQVTLTDVRVIRDGVVIDLRDSLSFEVFRRESQLEQGVLDGRLTAYAQIPGLRVGDLVDVAYVRRSTPKIAGALRAVWERLEFSVPTAVTRVVVHWPKHWTMHVGALPDRVERVTGPDLPGTRRHEWRRTGDEGLVLEDDVPDGANPRAELGLSAHANWGPVAAAVTPYYAADYPLTAEWEAKLAQIAALPGPEAQAIAALRLVQDDIRYVSLSVGVGSYIARPPAEVIATGFGDCKDKALLLRVMLSRLGIGAVVALTDLDDGHALAKQQPMVWAFDHMILRVRVAGRTVWVDPTSSYQGGGFDSATPPDYGYALPLTGAAQRQLEPLPVTAELVWNVAVTERFQFTWAGVFLNVRTSFRGGAADYNRQRIATEPRSRIGAEYLEFYAGRYPGITIAAPLQVTDDRAANLLRMEERYFLPRRLLDENDLRENFPFGAENFASALTRLPRAPRQLPLASGAPSVNRHRIEIVGAPITFNPPDPVLIANDAFRYSMTGAAREKGRMNLSWQHVRTGRVIEAAKVAGLVQDAQRVRDATIFYWDLTDE